MNKRTYSIFKASGLIGLLVIGFVVGMMYLPSVHDAIYQQPTETTVWQLVQTINPLAAEGNPGAGSSGFLEIFFTNHSASPDTAYNENTSATIEGWCVANMPGKTPYASADAFCTELNYGVTFDIVVKVRYNKTNAWDGAKFINSNCRVNITLTGFGTAGMTEIIGSQVVLRNDTSDDFIWLSYYWQDVDGAFGSGFSITKGSPWTANKITEIKIWAKY
jgi:hypothetical protein